MKPLDFIKTTKGAIGIVTEMNYPVDGCVENQYSISFIGDSKGEKSAWWTEREGIEVIDNLPSLLARTMFHPFGKGEECALDTYPKKQENE